MGTWNSRGLRGSTLEDLINHTNESYREKGLALIQKIPTPITPIEIDKQNRHITLAYFDQKSTVDYIGAVQGIPVCFDAKECAASTFPLQNIHPHQMQFMREFERQGGSPLLFCRIRPGMRFFICRWRRWKRFGSGWRMGGVRALPTTRWTSGSASEGAGICWSIIWNRFRWTWMAGKRRMGAKMIDKRGIVPYNETHTLLNYHFTM